MSANINDKITAVRSGSSNAPVTTVSTGRSIGGTSLACADLTGWPTDTAVHFQTYQKKADGTKNFATACDWKGIVSGNTIGSLTLENGTDAANEVGDYVEMVPTAAWGQDLYDGLTQTLNADGTLKSGIVGTDEIASGAVTTDSIADSTITDGNIDFSTFPAFSVYKADSWVSPSNTTGKINFNTVEYDTGSNFDHTTNFRFTAPKAGYYQFYALASVGSSAANMNLYLYKNGSQVRRGNHSSSGSFSCDISGQLLLAANDYIEVYMFSSASETGSVGAGITYFEGRFVRGA